MAPDLTLVLLTLIVCLPSYRTAAAAKEAEEEPAAGAIRSGIRTARLALQEVAGPLRAFEEGAKNIYETGKAHSACEFVDHLR